MKPVYLDHHSTTPVDPRVLEAMLPCFTEDFGNAASRTHAWGWRAEQKVEDAREQVARLLGAESREIVFTSGATESDNLAVLGVAQFYRSKGQHIVTTCIEHKAVLDPVRHLESQGFRVTVLPVDREGLVDLDRLAAALTPQTTLVSVMAANNEIGVIQDIEAIGRLCHERGVIFHTDAAQAAGHVPLDVQQMHLDLVSLSAHKMYGPKGVGALYVRRKSPRVRLAPLIHGGGHERGMRSGTLNVPGIVGLGKACEIAAAEMADENRRLASLRDRLHRRLVEALDDVVLNGHPTRRLPHNLNLSFKHTEGESLLMSVRRDVALSSGSACTSSTLEPSYVLRALGLSDDLAQSSVRFGLGRFNTEEEIDWVAERIADHVRRLREMSPRGPASRRMAAGTSRREPADGLPGVASQESA